MALSTLFAPELPKNSEHRLPAFADAVERVSRELRVEAQAIDGLMRKAYACFVKRKFHVTLLEHEEGVSVSCPELPGCHSQGANVEEALENIEDAIRGYIDLYGAPETRCEIREMEVVTA